MRYLFHLRPMVRPILSLMFLTTVTAGSVAVAQSSTYWTNPGPGDWFGENWNAGLPTNGTNAYIDLREPDNPIAAIDGTGVFAEAQDVYLGHSQGSSSLKYLGHLEVTGGAALSCQSLTLGSLPFSFGYMHISGDNSEVTSQMDGIAVGYQGEGEILVENQGQLISTTMGISLGRQQVDLTPPPSDKVPSKGTLTVTSGGSVTTPAIAIGEVGQGFLTVSGAGSLDSSGGAMIGNGSQSDGSQATVTGANSVWTSGSISVGNQGSATLTIEQGGRIDGASLSIGSDTDQSGAVSISGSTSQLDLSGNILIRRGSLTINSGWVGAASLDMHSNGWVTMQDGTLDVDELNAIDGQANLQGGTLNVGKYLAGTHNMDNNGAIVDPKGYLLEVLAYSSGNYRWYDQDAGSLWIDVDGTPQSGQFDKVVAEQVSFDGGNLQLDFSYVPAAGTTYEFLDALVLNPETGVPLVVHGLPSHYSVEVDLEAGTFTVIPEPTALFLLGGAVLAFACRRTCKGVDA